MQGDTSSDAEDASEAPTDWTTIVATVVAASAFAAEQGVTYPLISLMLERSAVDTWLIGLNVAFFTAGLALAALWICYFLPLFSLKTLMWVGLVGSGVSLLAFYVTDSFLVWCISRFILGFFASITYVASEAVIQSSTPDSIRGRVSGFYAAGISFGFAIGPVAIPIFGTESKAAFLAVAIYVLVVAVLVMVLVKKGSTRVKTEEQSGVLRWIYWAPSIFLMALAFGYADTVAISLMPVFLVQEGHSETFAAFTVTMNALPTVIAQPFVGLILDRFARELVAMACCVVTAACFFMLAVVTEPAIMLFGYAVIGICTLALYTCALTLLGERYTGADLVAGSGALSLGYALGGVATIATSILMSVAGAHAAPISVGLLMLAFVVPFGLSRSSGQSNAS
ncbi:MAG: MFS transporter [Pseudomonadota bacterium]